jgi:hypothetical protein
VFQNVDSPKGAMKVYKCLQFVSTSPLIIIAVSDPFHLEGQNVEWNFASAVNFFMWSLIGLCRSKGKKDAKERSTLSEITKVI